MTIKGFKDIYFRTVSYRDHFQKILNLLNRFIDEKTKRLDQVAYFKDLYRIEFPKLREFKSQLIIDSQENRYPNMRSIYNKGFKDYNKFFSFLFPHGKKINHTDYLVIEKSRFNKLVNNLNNDIEELKLDTEKLASLPPSTKIKKTNFFGIKIKKEIKSIRQLLNQKKFKQEFYILSLIIHDLNNHRGSVAFQRRYDSLRSTVNDKLNYFNVCLKKAVISKNKPIQEITNNHKKIQIRYKPIDQIV